MLSYLRANSARSAFILLPGDIILYDRSVRRAMNYHFAGNSKYEIFVEAFARQIQMREISFYFRSTQALSFVARIGALHGRKPLIR